MSPVPEAPLISAMGEAGYLLESRSDLNDDDQRRVWAMAEAVSGWTEVKEVVIGVNNILVLLQAGSTPDIVESLRRAWLTSNGLRPRGRLIRIPVDYGGPAALDLDDLVASTGLCANEIIRLHSEAEYTVFTIGSMPGFCYLSGLHPRLATPRRKVPRTRVEVGSVILGGAQAGVMPISAPSGWHILGHTDVRLFNPSAAKPVLLEPGDRVRFEIRTVER